MVCLFFKKKSSFFIAHDQDQFILSVMSKDEEQLLNVQSYYRLNISYVDVDLDEI